ncbi:multidrug resistance efflux transporter family protein [Luteimonas arsenica]|uniref:multidrug resistance efflux transporter family protein n=1 Tax=Luteimonas arsenica TaxID=1586242 RepID=UPI001FB77EDF|nr:multidrug resistance efflux transporter family protein [Luteimonas arsenica]
MPATSSTPRARPEPVSQDAPATGLALAAVGIGLGSALFFTMTYVLNRVSASAGGDWTWTASLRYLITLPLLLPLLHWQGGGAPVWRAIRRHPWTWLRCSAIGFGAFYLLLSFAASSGPSWLVAGSFQFTVVAGILCAPFLYRDARRRIPPAALMVAALILAGVLLLQAGHGGGAIDRAGWIALACVLGAAVAYPLGNRLLLLHLERSGEDLNATQRVFGMTLASQPLWWAVAAWAWTRSGAPPVEQVWLAGGVALSAGVIATILFFQATGMVRNNPTALGAVEAMQGSELLFAILIGTLFLHEPLPGIVGLLGGLLIVGGIVAFAWLVARPAAGSPARARALRTDKGA